MPQGLTNFARLTCDMCGDPKIEESLLVVDPEEAGVIENSQVTATHQCLIPGKHIINKFKICKSPDYEAQLTAIVSSLTRELSNPLYLNEDPDMRSFLAQRVQEFNLQIIALKENPNLPHPCLMIPSKWHFIEKHVTNGLDYAAIAQVAAMYSSFYRVCLEIQYLIKDAYETLISLTQSNAIKVADIYIIVHTAMLKRLIRQLNKLAKELVFLVDSYKNEFLWAVKFEGAAGAVKVLNKHISIFNESLTYKKSGKRKMLYNSQCSPVRLFALYGDKYADEEDQKKIRKSKELYEKFCEEYGDQEGVVVPSVLSDDLINSAKVHAMTSLKRCMYLIQVGSEYMCGVLTSEEFPDSAYQKLQGSYYDDNLKELILGIKENLSLFEKEEKITYLLNMKSYLQCRIGGKIEPTDSGQWFIESRNKVLPNFIIFLDDILSHIAKTPDPETLFKDAEQSIEPGSTEEAILKQNKEALRNVRKLNSKIAEITKLIKISLEDKEAKKNFVSPAIVHIRFYTKNDLNKARDDKMKILSGTGLAFTIAGAVVAFLGGVPAVTVGLGAGATVTAVGGVSNTVSFIVWFGGTITTLMGVGVDLLNGQLGLTDLTGTADQTAGGITQNIISEIFQNKNLGYVVDVAEKVGPAATGVNLFASIASFADLLTQQYHDYYIAKVEMKVDTDTEAYTFVQDYDENGNKVGGLQADLNIYSTTFMQNIHSVTNLFRRNIMNRIDWDAAAIDQIDAFINEFDEEGNLIQ